MIVVKNAHDNLPTKKNNSVSKILLLFFIIVKLAIVQTYNL
jgi:hypothetical protein